MSELTNRNQNWKYFINLCGQDFPLKTPEQIVRSLQGLYPKNAIESVKMPPNKVARYAVSYDVVRDKSEYGQGQGWS